MNHPRAWRALFNLAGLSLAALMLNCGGGGSTPPPPPPPPVATSLTTSNATPAFGGTFTLTPTYSAGTGSLNNGVTCPATGVATAPITANWAGARIYTLTVTNSAGATATKSVTVTPTVVTVGAISPAAITRTVSTATTFTTTVTGGALNTVTWSSTAGTWAGNVWTAPATAGTVTITATSVDDSTKTATTTVTVVGAPVAASLVTSRTTPAFGEVFTLTPTYGNGVGALNYGVVCPATGVPVNVTANWSGTRTFVLTVTNAAGLAATTSVDVTPQTVAVGPIVFFPATPVRTVNSVTAFTTGVTGGALNTVTWTATAGSFAGDVWTAPAGAGVVTITATSVDDPTKTNTTTITVIEAPNITAFAAAKGTITNGTGTSLSYAFNGGAGVITPGDIAVTTGGTTNVNPTTDTTYTLTVTNATGDIDTETVTITVVPVATITVFTASAATVAPGGTVSLHTEFAGGLGYVNQGLGPVANGGDVVSSPLTATTIFTLTVTNAAGDSVTQDVTVTVVAPGAFTAAGTMSSPRSVPTATLLTDNSVLIVGGNSGGSLNTADVYSGGYTATGVMAVGRYSHAATRLPDGKVLITGGYDSTAAPGSQVLASAEIYDPSTGTFTPTGAMTTARMDHTATLLSNGLVLIAGGTDNISIKGAELYDPTTGIFTALTGPNGWDSARTRATHTATLLADGRVLLAGGYQSVVWGTADVYDPALNTFTAVSDLNQIRWGHTATLLPDGKVLIAGGRNGIETTGAVLATAEIFDPVAGTFSVVTAPMISAREWHAASLLADGKVLIVGGDRDETVPGGPLTYLASAEIYDPIAGTFTTTASMATARINATATLVPTGPGTGFVLIAGGGGIAATERFE